VSNGRRPTALQVDHIKNLLAATNGQRARAVAEPRASAVHRGHPSVRQAHSEVATAIWSRRGDAYAPTRPEARSANADARRRR